MGFTRVRPPERFHRAFTAILALAALACARGGDVRRVVTFEGACDASGSVELDERTLVVADDEDNVLRVYDADRGGPPLHEIDLTQDLGLEKEDRESDLEAATRIGNRAYFLASHGRTAKGSSDPNRLLLFATTLARDGQGVALVGQPYRSLLQELEADPRFAPFGLTEAASRAPKEPGGLNIEGMTAGLDESVLIGFRSPIPEGRALLVRLLNPDGVLAGEKGRFSEPIRLDLGGLGVRALSFWRSSYLVLAGPSGEGGPFHLFRMDARMNAQRVSGLDFDGFGAEGFFTPDSRDEVLVLSDDGTRRVNGRPCKKLKRAADKSFRGVWVRLPR